MEYPKNGNLSEREAGAYSRICALVPLGNITTKPSTAATERRGMETFGMDRFFAFELSDAERDALTPNSLVRHRCGICPTRAAQGDFGESQTEASKVDRLASTAASPMPLVGKATAWRKRSDEHSGLS